MQVYRLKGVLLAAEVADRLTSAASCGTGPLPHGGHDSSLYGAGAGAGGPRVTPAAVECTLAALTTRLTGKPACLPAIGTLNLAELN